MKEEFTPKSRKDNLVVQELDGEVLIYDLQNDKAFCLNITSALVWQACDGTKNVSQISRWVGEKLNTANNEDLVWLALDQLKKEKLIENGAEVSEHFEGLSRRQVIKKIGLSSLVAVPVVASLVAPVAGATASICGAAFNMTCTCPFPGCPFIGNPQPAPGPAATVTCAGTPDCSPGATPAACVCRGPFTCINGSTIQGMCS